MVDDAPTPDPPAPTIRRPGGLGAWLELLRLPNLLTVPGDVLAGWLLAFGARAEPDGRLGVLMAAGLCIYAFGLVLNDLSDVDIDAQERPTRPLPSGRVSRPAAHAGAALALAGGLGGALVAGGDAFRCALFLVIAIFAYNQQAKRDAVAGPLVMGLCRGLNLLLGASVMHIFPTRVWLCAGIEIAFIAAVTALARREMAGGRVKPRHIGLLLSLLLPLQAAFCASAGAGRFGWICAGALLACWPLHRLLARRFAPS